jgi:hypothetical protein
MHILFRYLIYGSVTSNKIHWELSGQIVHGVLRTLGRFLQNVNNTFLRIWSACIRT